MRVEAICLALLPLVHALGQESILTFGGGRGEDNFRLAGDDQPTGQILVSSDDYWGVIRAAGDLAVDFGRVTGTNFTISNGEDNAEPAVFEFEPVDVRDNTVFSTNDSQTFSGPTYSDPDFSAVRIIAGTIGHSSYIDALIEDGKIDVSAIEGEWESFITQLVEDPVEGVTEALVIAGSMPRGTIYGLYDISEQMGVSPWYFWADVPTRQYPDILVPRGSVKTQGPPSVKYRGIFLNDEQPGLTNWVSENWDDAWNGSAGYNHRFYALVAELLLRLRANYLWPTLWASIFYVDDPLNQPLMHAYEIVMGSSHTEPLMRAQNEFLTYYEGPWAYNENNETIDEYFRYGVQRARPYERNSLWTMSMRGSGDTAIEGLGIDAITSMLETLVDNQRKILAEGLDVDLEDIATVPQTWCLYNEVQSYQERGLTVPEDITLLWSDDNWGNVRRLPLANETERTGGAGVYYHFDYVGATRDYKWINTVQLGKTTSQMQLAYARGADRIWVVNVGDLKPLEIPISHFLDMAYDAERWGIDSTADWVQAWAEREFGGAHAEHIASVVGRYGKYAARRKYELVDASTYSVIHYNEAEAVLSQWSKLEEDAQFVYDAFGEEDDGDSSEQLQAAYFQMVLHPVRAGKLLHEIYVSSARNSLYAGQKRNSANEVADRVRELGDDDADLTIEWDEMLDGKWAHMLDQTHLGYDGYWQQPMRNTLPPLVYVQNRLTSLAGNVRLGIEASNASIPGDDKYHPNSGNTLTLPPLDRYGAQRRWFDVFSAGTVERCEWEAAVSEDWVTLSEREGVVGTAEDDDEVRDRRVFVSVDWDDVPESLEGEEPFIVTINVTTPCRARDKSKYGYDEPVIELPVYTRQVPASFEEGFVESDGHIAIEAPHYQRVVNATSPSRTSSSNNNNNNNNNNNLSSSSEAPSYHVFRDYGRTLGGVGLVPLSLEKLAVDAVPSLEYDLYVFSNDTLANVTLLLNSGHNYLGEAAPLEYAVSLHAESDDADPRSIRYVGPPATRSMPVGWDRAVADDAWGGAFGLARDVAGVNTTTTGFQVGDVGVYKLRLWLRMPNVVVQKIVVDLGGVRESYLGPPESFLVGRDEVGGVNRTSFADVLGLPEDETGSGHGDHDEEEGSDHEEGHGEEDGDTDESEAAGSRMVTGLFTVVICLLFAL